MPGLLFLTAAVMALAVLSGRQRKRKSLPAPPSKRVRPKITGFERITSPAEAAAVLMVATARLGEPRPICDAERAAMLSALTATTGMEVTAAGSLLRQVEAITSEIVRPETALTPMLRILQDRLDTVEARALADALEDVADSDGVVTASQAKFVREYRERMNLL